MEPFDEQTAAATVIQATFRKRRDRQRAQDQRAFTDRNEVEMDSEVAFLRQNESLCAVDDLLDRSHSEKRKQSPAWVAKVESVHIEPDYKGPHLPLQPTRYDAEQLVAFYRGTPGGVLHKKYALQLCMAARDYLSSQIPTALHHMPLEEGRKMYVLGDTHGQLEDVLWIFHEHGLPSASTPYLFNGDVTDRGERATEILLILFAFMVTCPGSVFMNRGNHEAVEMNTAFGFGGEVRVKYGHSFYRFFSQVVGPSLRHPARPHPTPEVFELLPLATLVDDCVLVLHGGLPRKSGVTLDHIRTVDHRRNVPDSPMRYQDVIFYDILWADPRARNGVGPNERGGSTITFGPVCVPEPPLGNPKMS